MYVCLCNGHRSQDIERAARECNLTCARAVYDVLGGPVCCGICIETARDLVDDVHAGGSGHQTPCGLAQPIAANSDRATHRILAAE